jgi:hypothetical protein
MLLLLLLLWSNYGEGLLTACCAVKRRIWMFCFRELPMPSRGTPLSCWTTTAMSTREIFDSVVVTEQGTSLSKNCSCRFGDHYRLCYPLVPVPSHNNIFAGFFPQYCSRPGQLLLVYLFPQRQQFPDTALHHRSCHFCSISALLPVFILVLTWPTTRFEYMFLFL